MTDFRKIERELREYLRGYGFDVQYHCGEYYMAMITKHSCLVPQDCGGAITKTGKLKCDYEKCKPLSGETGYGFESVSLSDLARLLADLK